MDGTLAGTDSWFMNPSAQVSAHFGVGKHGAVHQYVDTSVVAWAEANYNGEAISIEHEGNSGDSLTPQQIAADIPLIRWLNQTSGLPFVMTNANGTGWVGHGQLGAGGGSHPNCPGQPILDQWPGVLLSAQGSTPAPAPAPLPQESEDMDDNTFVRWCYKTLLFRTVDDVGFAANMKWLAAGGPRSQVYTNLCDSPEGQRATAAERKLLAI
jgi:hypothetical protein